jgi:hypothetical protein
MEAHMTAQEFLLRVLEAAPSFFISFYLGRMTGRRDHLNNKGISNKVIVRRGIGPYREPASSGDFSAVTPDDEHFKDTLFRHDGPQTLCPSCNTNDDAWECDNCKGFKDEDEIRKTGSGHSCGSAYTKNGTCRPRLGPALFCTNAACFIKGEHMHQSCGVCHADWVCTPKRVVKTLAANGNDGR